MPGAPSSPPLRLDEVWRGLVADAQHGPLPGILVLLTGVAGVVDAVSILRLDRVFVANITGNIIFIALALVGTRGYSITAPTIVFASFLAGAAALAPRPVAHRGRAAHAAVVVQLIDLALGTGLFAASPHPGTGVRDALLVVLALGMGAKSALVRAVNVPGLTTSVFTSTLTGLAADAARGAWRKPMYAVQIVAVFALLVGAILGAVLALKTFAWCPLALATVALVPTVWWSRAAARSTSSWATPTA
jgi:uncharacterized membrane protein YoaK (UPF0700 family)